jgi:hypothetical protein
VSATEDFARRLVAEVPELKPVLAEHLEDNFDELLPHVFFGDVSRWAESEVAADPADPAVQRLIDELSTGFTDGAPEVRDLITVSFLENLDDDSPVLAVLSPPLRAKRARLDE